VPEVISAIDIGTTKICALMANVEHDSLGNPGLRVVGMGVAPSRGIRRGVVVHVGDAIASVGEAVEKCEAAAGRQMLSALVGIAGSHITTLNSKGMSPVDRRLGVTQDNMQQALESARAVALPSNQEVIHTIARHWTVDEQDEIQYPVGMTGYRLEVDAHIVTASSSAASNLVRCVHKHGIDVSVLVLEPLASSSAVLKPDERRMGVAVVDMGGGTSDIAIFRNEGLCHTRVIDVGGNHLSNDVAIALHTSFETAEGLKVRYGHVVPERIAADETIWAQVFGDRSERNFSRRFLCEVLEARAVEMFEIIKDHLQESGNLDRLPAGLVLTGGASQLPGMAELGRSVLGMPVRLGTPLPSLPIVGLNQTLRTPAYATTVGLLAWGLTPEAPQWGKQYSADAAPATEEPANLPGWLAKTRELFRHLLPG